MRFLFKTDNTTRKYFSDQQNLNARQKICLSFLSEYNLEIKHIKGKVNKIVDVLSGKLNEIYISNLNSHLKQKIKSKEKNDKTFGKLREKVQNDDLGKKGQNSSLIKMDQYHKRDKIYIPIIEDLKNLILTEVDKKPYSSNQGYQKTIITLKKVYYLSKNENQSG